MHTGVKVKGIYKGQAKRSHKQAGSVHKKSNRGGQSKGRVGEDTE